MYSESKTAVGAGPPLSCPGERVQDVLRQAGEVLLQGRALAGEIELQVMGPRPDTEAKALNGDPQGLLELAHAIRSDAGRLRDTLASIQAQV